MFGGGAIFTPEDAPVVAADTARLVEAMQPYDSGSTYLNFVEGNTHVWRAFDAGSWRRLQQVRADYDPEGMFLANHEIR
jgi:hypothetical protein